MFQTKNGNLYGDFPRFLYCFNLRYLFKVYGNVKLNTSERIL